MAFISSQEIVKYGGSAWESNPPTAVSDGAPGLKPGGATRPLALPPLGLPGTPAAPGEPGYRCSLSGLAGFTGIRRAGPGSQANILIPLS